MFKRRLSDIIWNAKINREELGDERVLDETLDALKVLNSDYEAIIKGAIEDIKGGLRNV